MRVLLVDDQEKILEFVADIILDISSNIDVVACNSWRVAEKALQQNDKFDLILLDVVMPEVDGIQAYKFIKEQYRLDKKTVYMTCANLKGVHVEIPILPKPFNEKDIYKLIVDFCPIEEAGLLFPKD